MKKPVLLLLIWTCWIGHHAHAQPIHSFHTLPTQWDEAIPLGNGMLGALVWQKEDAVRFSLDRADLWDSRPMKGLHRDEFRYDWVYGQVQKKEYKVVQDHFDAPYDHEPAPTKIPGAGLEFRVAGLGQAVLADLDLAHATSRVAWANGTSLSSFVHATKPLGWFRFEHLKAPLDVRLVAPGYQAAVKNKADPVGGDDLGRLGYPQGTVDENPGSIRYMQQGWGGFWYEVKVQWKQTAPGTVEGIWTIASHPEVFPNSNVSDADWRQAMQTSWARALESHLAWWKDFWGRSDITIPDTLILHQWYMEQYKFGSAARRNAPPISLQAIWTADNGRIPPWKGDFHHDLNTQLSYWPAYSANHLEEAMGYIDHFEANKANYERYAKQYFGKKGIAVPGVTTLDGTEMGGWIQYSLSPTVCAWISQHYYLQWRYSMDRTFLKGKAYPWVRSTAEFLEDVTVLDEHGHRGLRMSSSPEIHDNDLKAWFPNTTNYDLALLRYDFRIAAELANELGLKSDAKHWKSIGEQLPAFALSEKNELLVAPGEPYAESHRHFSNLMAIHPLGLYQWDRSDHDRSIIRNSINLLDSIGPDWWCGYSYAWEANLKARAKDGDGAVKALTIFSKAFCSGNSFHLNGDQTKSGLSKFTYRPFTLEGNFAFASGVQEMLMQSFAGYIDLFPALPDTWKDVSFTSLRAEGAFLVSAVRKGGKLHSVVVKSEKGGVLTLKMPQGEFVAKLNGKDVLPKMHGQKASFTMGVKDLLDISFHPALKNLNAKSIRTIRTAIE